MLASWKEFTKTFWRRIRLWADGSRAPYDLILTAAAATTALVLLLWTGSWLDVYGPTLRGITIISFPSAAIFGFLVFTVIWRRRLWRHWQLWVTFASTVLLAKYATTNQSWAMDAGRDTGVYLQTALWLAERGTFFVPGAEATTWLGFDEVRGGHAPAHRTGYSVYLAPFLTWFGMSGVGQANFILLAGSSWLLATCVWLLSRRWVAVAGALALLFTSYMTVWFAKGTHAENIQLPLVLTLATVLLVPWRSVSKLTICLPVAGLLLASRTDAPLFIAAFLAAVASPKNLRLTRKTAAALGAAAVGLAVVVIVAFHDFRLGFGPAALAWYDFASPNETTYASVYPAIIVGLAFEIGLLPLLLLLGFMPHSSGIKRLLILFAPAAVYLILPVISPDSPWILRHLWATALPLAILVWAAAFGYFSSRGRGTILALCVAGIVAAQGVSSAAIVGFQEDVGTRREFESLLALTPANSTLLLPPGRIGVHAGSLQAVYGVKTLQPPNSLPWAPRFPGKNYFDAGNFSKYVDESIIVVAVPTVPWLDVAWSGFFLASDLRQIGEVQISTRRLEAECQLIHYLTAEATWNKVDGDFVSRTCRELPLEMQVVSTTLEVFIVDSLAAIPFFSNNSGVRLSENWALNGSNVLALGTASLRVSAAVVAVAGSSDGGGLVVTHGSRRLALADGPFSLCLSGPDIRFEGRVTISSVKARACLPTEGGDRMDETTRFP